MNAEARCSRAHFAGAETTRARLVDADVVDENVSTELAIARRRSDF
jgi:hypothetical protein